MVGRGRRGLFFRRSRQIYGVGTLVQARGGRIKLAQVNRFVATAGVAGIVVGDEADKLFGFFEVVLLSGGERLGAEIRIHVFAAIGVLLFELGL